MNRAWLNDGVTTVTSGLAGVLFMFAVEGRVSGFAAY